MPLAFAAAVAGAFGATIGSFLNVVAYRLPRRESLVRPGSHCPGCGTAIKAYDNVPVLGWLLAARPVPQLPDADLAALSDRRGAHGGAGRRGRADQALGGRRSSLGLVLVAVLVPIALIDFEHRIIPNKITLPAAVAAVAIGVALDLRACPSS